MKVTAPGIYQMSKDDYVNDPCPEPSLSHSLAVRLLQDSPAHAWASSRRLNPNWREKRSEEMDRGQALHSLFLEGVNVMRLVDVDPDKDGKYTYRTKLAQEQRNAAYAEGSVPVLKPEYDRMMSLLGTLERRMDEVEEERKPFSKGKAEQVVIWLENGIWCRARLDWLSDDRLYIDDLKTAASANPGRGFGQFGRAFWAYGYDVQAEFYRRGIRNLLGIDATFRHIAFELSPPNAISVCQLGAAGKAVGAAKVERALAIWGECLSTNRWPDYPRYAVEMEPPDYEITALEAQEGL